jgi:hypothetical protein
VYGDKETFWLACVMNNKPFFMNEAPGVNLLINPNLPHCGKVSFSHFYNLNFFFSQKAYPKTEIDKP